jgi:hypothetical protein
MATSHKSRGKLETGLLGDIAVVAASPIGRLAHVCSTGTTGFVNKVFGLAS